jgi:Tfp pilus assembly protein PilF
LAGLLPPLLYLSQYVTNEGMAAALVSASLYLTLRMIQRESVSWKACAGLGICLGAALLTKLTAVLVVPLAFSALRWKAASGSRSVVCGLWSGAGRRQLRHWAVRMGLVLGVFAVVCGWYYLRVWAHDGLPRVGVWSSRTGFGWWQDDGFRTSAFYVRFGQTLVNPWFGSFNSFADGIYCSLWGDGLFGGVPTSATRPPWNYELMAIGYWLALAPTLGVLVGAVLAVVRFVRDPSAEWFMVLGLGFLLALTMIHMSIVAPYYCLVKAIYGMSGLLPLCACGALGLNALSRRSGKLRLVMCVTLGAWALTSYTSFWIVRSSVPALLARSRALLEGQRYVESAAVLSTVLNLQPGNALAHHQLALALGATGRTKEAIEQYTEVLRLDPESDGALNNLAWIRAAHPQAEFRDGAEAVRLAERACRVDGYQEAIVMGTLAAAYAEAGRFDEAVAMATRARDRARELGRAAVAEKNEDLIRLFTARQPYREP